MATSHTDRFNAAAPEYDFFLPMIEPVTTEMLRHVRLSEGCRVLDIACGTGEPGLTIARSGVSGLSVVGIDPAQVMLKEAEKKVAQWKLSNVTFQEMKAEKLDLPDNSFDIVTSRFGLMFTSDVEAACREMVRVLKPGGQFVASVWESFDFMPVVHSVTVALAPYTLPEFQRVATDAVKLAGDSLPSRLKEVGAEQVDTCMFEWVWDAPYSAEDIWEHSYALRSRWITPLSEEQKAAAKPVYFKQIAPYWVENRGAYSYRIACRIVWGRK